MTLQVLGRLGALHLEIVDATARIVFYSSLDGKDYRSIGMPFQAEAGQWIGAKVGIFASGVVNQGEVGYSDYDWFCFEPEA